MGIASDGRACRAGEWSRAGMAVAVVTLSAGAALAQTVGPTELAGRAIIGPRRAGLDGDARSRQAMHTTFERRLLTASGPQRLKE